MWPITCRPTSGHPWSGSDIASGYFDPETLPKKSKLAGFCTNDLCFGRPNRDAGERYFVPALTGFNYLATTDKSKVTCPNCHHALFWGRNWELLTDEECKKRRVRTLKQLYDLRKTKSH